MKVEISALALSDLDDIAAFIAEDNPARAVTFIDEIKSHVLKIGKTPFAYPQREEIGVGVRFTVHGHYIILFRVLEAVVSIDRVVRGGRDLVDMI